MIDIYDSDGDLVGFYCSDVEIPAETARIRGAVQEVLGRDPGALSTRVRKKYVKAAERVQGRVR